MLWATLRNASGSLLDELVVSGGLLAVGGPLLLLTIIVTEKLFLPKINLANEIALQKNMAAGMMCAAASITTAVLLAGLIVTR